MSKPFPGVDVPVIDLKTGLMTQTWTEYFQSIQTYQYLAHLRDVSTTAPTNNQVLTFKTATGLWTPV